MEYPYILDPDRHQLKRFYRNLNWAAIFCIPLLCVVNEIFIRPFLPKFRSSEDSIFSLFALSINFELSFSGSHHLFKYFSVLAISIACLFFLQPKWKLNPKDRIFSKGLPTYSEYESAYFYIENSIQRMSFWAWHRPIVGTVFLLYLSLFCSLFNLLRK